MERIETRVAYQNHWMQVREDTIRRDDGSAGIYGYVDKPDFSLVIPRERGGFWLVEQFRYPIQQRAWEFPQGSWPSGRSGTAEELARSELLEETGLSAGQVRHLGRLTVAHGMSNQGMNVFIATDFLFAEPHREASERDMVHQFVTDASLLLMIERGEFIDAPSLAAYALFTLDSRP